jgi:hypothetical protein
MSAWPTFTEKLVAAATVRQRAAAASELMRQTELRGSIIAADAEHARRLEAAEEKYKAAVCDAALAFEQASGVRPQH